MIYNENGEILSEGSFSKLIGKDVKNQKNADNIQSTVSEPKLSDDQAEKINQWIESSYVSLYKYALSQMKILDKKYPKLSNYFNNSDDGIGIYKWKYLLNTGDYFYNVKDDMYKGKVKYEFINAYFSSQDHNIQKMFSEYIGNLMNFLNSKNTDKNISFDYDGSGEESYIYIIFDINRKIK